MAHRSWTALLILALLPTGGHAQTTEPGVPPPPGTAPAQPGTQEVPPPPGADAPEAPPENTAPEEPAAGDTEAEPEAPAPISIISRNRKALGTRVQILLYPANGDKAGAEAAMERAFAEMERVGTLLNAAAPQGDINQLNRAAGAAVGKAVAPETLEVLSKGKQVWELSGGAFAMTKAAVGGMWDFNQGENEPKRLPDAATLSQRLGLIDDSAIEIDLGKGTARLTGTGMVLGLDGIRNGYVIAKGLQVLQQAGFGDALVFVGGDVGAIGGKGEQAWLVGLQDPRAEGYFATLPLQNESVAVAGDYEQFFVADGKRYHHLIDPKTGYPATEARAVAVVGPDPALADALSAGVFVLGPKRGMELIEKHQGYETLIVDAQNQVSISSGLQNRVRILRAPTEDAGEAKTE